MGSLTLDEGSVTVMEIDGLTRGSLFDAIDVTSGLTYGGTLELSFGGTFADNTSFALFNLTTGSPTGGFASIVAAGAYGPLTFTNDGGVWSSGPTAVGGQTMTFTESTGTLVIVPEPHGLALGGLGALLAAWAQLRRRR